MRYLAILVAFVLAPLSASEFEIGDTLQLIERDNDLGIPVHDQAGSRGGVNRRFPSGGTVTITDLSDGHLNWIEVKDDSTSGWIVTRYVAEKIDSSTSNPMPSDQGSSGWTIGTWNIEHFGHGKKRGFPENTRGGPSYAARTPAQIERLASVIENRIDAEILVLVEINGRTDNGHETSDEMEDLISYLGDDWDYAIGKSGGSQRLVFLYDTDEARLDHVIEIPVPPKRIEGKDIFARDPLIGHFTLLNADGSEAHDVVVVGVHLASGQDNERNHDAAMTLLREKLKVTGIVPDGEHDIIITGDYNANPFRPPVEEFFLTMDEDDGKWDLFADDNYPATRLSGVPLDFRTSQIDYVIATRHNGDQWQGLSGNEITQDSATVHTDIVEWIGGPDEFRREFSDHLPVTVEVK